MQHTIPFAIRSSALRKSKSYHTSLGFGSSMISIVIYYNLRALLNPQLAILTLQVFKICCHENRRHNSMILPAKLSRERHNKIVIVTANFHLG